MSDLVSIIVPVYNSEQYLKECLNSIINQSYSNLEIICIDDASTDSSLKILEEYKRLDSRIIIEQTNINCGVSWARNRGLERANGKYIVFIDSDDIISSNHVETLVSMVSHNVYLCKIEIQVFSDIINLQNQKNKYKLVNSKSFYKMFLAGHTGYAVYRYIYIASILNKNNIRFCSRTFEDYEFNLKYIKKLYDLKKANFVAVSKCKTYFYRKHSNSITTKIISDDVLNPLYIQDRILESISYPLQKIFKNSIIVRNSGFVDKLFVDLKIPNSCINKNIIKEIIDHFFMYYNPLSILFSKNKVKTKLLVYRAWLRAMRIKKQYNII